MTSRRARNRPTTADSAVATPELTPLEQGIVVGLLVGEGSFGGDGKQPQITLRMHVRHEALFQWLLERFPRTRLYGPYGHGGRSYYQWMARGVALVEDVLPIVERTLDPTLDAYAAQRLHAMRDRYADYIAHVASRRAALGETAEASPARSRRRPPSTAAS